MIKAEWFQMVVSTGHLTLPDAVVDVGIGRIDEVFVGVLLLVKVWLSHVVLADIVVCRTNR